jgi:hypothetical protein
MLMAKDRTGDVESAKDVIYEATTNTTDKKIFGGRDNEVTILDKDQKKIDRDVHAYCARLCPPVAATSQKTLKQGSQERERDMITEHFVRFSRALARQDRRDSAAPERAGCGTPSNLGVCLGKDYQSTCRHEIRNAERVARRDLVNLRL